MVVESISKFFRLVLHGVYIDGNVLVASLVDLFVCLVLNDASTLVGH